MFRRRAGRKVIQMDQRCFFVSSARLSNHLPVTVFFLGTLICASGAGSARADAQLANCATEVAEYYGKDLNRASQDCQSYPRPTLQRALKIMKNACWSQY